MLNAVRRRHSAPKRCRRMENGKCKILRAQKDIVVVKRPAGKVLRQPGDRKSSWRTGNYLKLLMLRVGTGRRLLVFLILLKLFLELADTITTGLRLIPVLT